MYAMYNRPVTTEFEHRQLLGCYSWCMLVCLQGAMQCCITGPAFEYLLQQPNQALVQAVMLNSVAFTRMRSHQKGQLMDLLGRKGLHHMFNGQRQHILVRIFMTDHFLFPSVC